jgi:hypothetical protein
MIPNDGRDRWAVCTIAAKRHLALGRVVCSSFAQHHPSCPVYLLLADEVDGYFDPASEPFRLVTLNDLTTATPAIGPMRDRYSQQEFSYALTPFLIEWLLSQGFDRVVFIKQESLVTGDLTPIVDLLYDSSILLTPHLLAPLSSPAREKNILQCGAYNGGFVAFADTPDARRFLRWWQQRLLANCLYAPASGMHFEQRWLDLAPAYIQHVTVVRDPGVNVGHWNLPERVVTVDGDTILIDGEPCRLFRFSGFDADYPQKPTRYFSRLTMENLGPAAAVFARYHEQLIRHGWAETKDWPYAFPRTERAPA